MALSQDKLEVLAQAGYREGSAGGVLLSGAAVVLRERLLAYLCGAVARFQPVSYEAPLFIAAETLARAGYLENFPQQVVLAGSYDATATERKYVTPAACLHLYPELAQRDLVAQPFVGFVVAHCARFEGGQWTFPFRSPEFHMAELVVVGPQDSTDELYADAERLLGSALAQLGLPGAVEAATDAFFLGASSGAKLMQQLKGLKKEYVVPCAGQRVAVASLNRHEDNFARRFALYGVGQAITSFCLAFGLERLVACGLLTWGADEAGWPPELRQA